MRRLVLAKILFLLTAFCAFSQIAPAQQTDSGQPNQSAEITKETDRLPFMKSENAAGASAEPTTGGLLIKSLGAMLLIVGLIFFGAWGLKKSGFGQLKPNSEKGAPDLMILSSVSLGSGRTISAVRFGERVLLVGSTAQAFTLLADENLSEGISPAAPRSVAELLSDENASFEDELELAQNKFALWGENGGQS